MSDKSLIHTEQLILNRWREVGLKVYSRVGTNPC